MRPIKYIVVHCTETQPTETLKSLRAKWSEENKGATPPFHFLVLADGEIEKLSWAGFITPNDSPNNKESVHIAYVGGLNCNGKPADTRTQRQKEALFYKLVQLSDEFRDAQIVGCSDFPEAKNDSPCFDVKEWIRNYEPDLSVDTEDLLLAA
jgi:N-acetylmuramoyl-L-alanine amidase